MNIERYSSILPGGFRVSRTNLPLPSHLSDLAQVTTVQGRPTVMTGMAKRNFHPKQQTLLVSG